MIKEAESYSKTHYENKFFHIRRMTNANYDKEHILKAWRELFEFDIEKGIAGDSI